MMHYFSGIRPADSFIVQTNYVASALSEDVLKRLYIPLIGIESVAVYQYLSQFAANDQLSEAVTHYVIVNELKMNLSTFEQLRMKLEGIGLLKSYLKVDADEQQFVYKLLSPVMPTQFFNDPMLSVFLFQVVGRERYKVLKAHFSTQLMDLNGFQEISKNYMDVYGTPKEPSAEMYEDNERLLKTAESAGIPVMQETFDFDMLEMLLNQNLITREQLPKETRELITQLAALYDIAPVDMRRIILKSLTSNQQISHEELRRNARDFYQIEHPGELPELKTKTTEPQVENEESKLSWFEMMDTTSPVEMLASLSQSEPTTKQKRMIETILEREKLPFGVMNILLQYVMFTHEMKLPQSYIEEIASNWKKLKLDSSRKAYDYAKKIQAKQAEPKVRTRRTNVQSYEMTPQWLNQQVKPEEQTTDVDLEEERRLLKEQLKTFWKEDES